MDEHELELDDIRDQAEVVGFLTPREYAKIRFMTPQLVYYHVRNKHIELEYCKCGRKVLNVAVVDEFFRKLRDKRGLTINHDD